MNESEGQPLTTLLLDLVKEQLSRQLDASNALETKAVGLLAFQGVVIAILVQTTWWPWVMIPIGLALISTVLALTTLWVADYHNGPDVPSFYETHSHDSALDATLWMIHGMAQAVQHNRPMLAQKSRRLVWALLGLIGTIIASIGLFFIRR